MLKKGLEAPVGNPSEVGSGRAEAAHAPRSAKAGLQGLEVLRHLRKLVVGEAGGHQAVAQGSTVAHVEDTAVANGALSPLGREHAPLAQFVDGSPHEVAVLHQGHRHGVGRKVVNEVGRAVQRVDDPVGPALNPGLAPFFAEHAAARQQRGQAFDEHLLGLLVDVAHQRVECLGLNRVRLEFAAFAADPVAYGAHGFSEPWRVHTAEVWAGSAAGRVATVSRGVSSVSSTQARVPASIAS